MMERGTAISCERARVCATRMNGRSNLEAGVLGALERLTDSPHSVASICVTSHVLVHGLKHVRVRRKRHEPKDESGGDEGTGSVRTDIYVKQDDLKKTRGD
jgi:hypothetical protein